MTMLLGRRKGRSKRGGTSGEGGRSGERRRSGERKGLQGRSYAPRNVNARRGAQAAEQRGEGVGQRTRFPMSDARLRRQENKFIVIVHTSGYW